MTGILCSLSYCHTSVWSTFSLLQQSLETHAADSGLLGCDAVTRFTVFSLIFGSNILPSSSKVEGSKRVQEIFLEPSNIEDEGTTFIHSFIITFH
jgi:hypothetical protein